MLKLRFSLLSLLLLTTLLAVAMSHVITSSELARVKKELTTVVKDLCVIDAKGVDGIYAVALPGNGFMQWRWRIQLPTKGTYRLRSSLGLIPETGLPVDSQPHNEVFVNQSGRPIAGGESILLFVGIYADQNGNCEIVTETPERRMSTPIKTAPPGFSGFQTMTWTSQSFDPIKTISSNATEPLVLVRMRKSRSTPAGLTVDPNPTDGAMIWVERVESAPNK